MGVIMVVSENDGNIDMSIMEVNAGYSQDLDVFPILNSLIGNMILHHLGLLGKVKIFNREM